MILTKRIEHKLSRNIVAYKPRQSAGSQIVEPLPIPIKVQSPPASRGFPCLRRPFCFLPRRSISPVIYTHSMNQSSPLFLRLILILSTIQGSPLQDGQVVDGWRRQAKQSRQRDNRLRSRMRRLSDESRNKTAGLFNQLRL